MNSDNPIQIRQAVAFDAEKLATIAAETFWDTYNGSIDHGDIWAFIRLHFTPEKIRNEINVNSGVYLIVENNEKEAVGYAKISADYMPRIIKGKRALEINKIYVSAKLKRSGIGKQLMDFIEKYAKQNTFNCLWLAVWEHNKNAIAFYTKMNYKKIADVPFEMGSETHNDYLVVKNI